MKKNLPDVCRILAPAGGMASLEAALRAGAEGVYFGASTLNARQKADNFSKEQLSFVAALCRAYGAESFLTLNTLLKKEEAEEVFSLLSYAAEAGITGVITQDLSLPPLIKKHFPTLEMHASTQMAVSSLEGVLALESLGFDQVVLARECRKEEIARIKAGSSIPLEVFCHGALCMSLSGQCYLSSLIGGRSGNRGLCAQPCRLDFSLPNFQKCLSLKDLSLLDEMSSLLSLGVKTVKIEGRLKRPEYVTAAVSAYRAARSVALGDQSKMEELEEARRLMENVFSRSGFTQGFYGSAQTKSMFGFRRAEDVKKADEETFAKLRRQSEKEPYRLPVTARFEAKAEKPCRLTLSDGERSLTFEGDTPQEARGEGLNKERITALLLQTGETKYTLSSLSLDLEEGLFLPDGSLRRLRRQALEGLDDARSAFLPPAPADKEAFLAEMRPEVPHFDRAEEKIAFCLNARQALGLNDSFDRVYLPYEQAVLYAKEGRLPFGVLMPQAFFAKDELSLAKKSKELTDYVAVQSLGGLFAAQKAGLRIVAGPIMNVRTAAAENTLKKLGAERVIRSFESHRSELADTGVESGMVIYGRLPLMALRACPNKAANGCESCKKVFFVRDRTGRTFPSFCQGEFSLLCNSDRLYLADKQASFAKIKTKCFLFTDETREEVAALVRAYETAASPQSLPFLGSFTRGLYDRKEERQVDVLKEQRDKKKRN